MNKLFLFLLLTSLSPLNAMNSFTARPLYATSNFTARNRTDGIVILRERTTTLEYSFLLPYITLSPNEEKQVSFPSGSELRIEAAGSLEVKKLGWHLKLLDIAKNGSTIKVTQLATRPLIIKKKGDIRDLLITTVSPDRSAREHISYPERERKHNDPLSVNIAANTTVLQVYRATPVECYPIYTPTDQIELRPIHPDLADLMVTLENDAEGLLIDCDDATGQMTAKQLKFAQTD